MSCLGHEKVGENDINNYQVDKMFNEKGLERSKHVA